MRRPINVPDDEEGLSYDPVRARREGIEEEIRITRVVHGQVVEVEFDEELFEELMMMFDFGVNTPPGERQVLDIRLSYEYNYMKDI